MSKRTGKRKRNESEEKGENSFSGQVKPPPSFFLFKGTGKTPTLFFFCLKGQVKTPTLSAVGDKNFLKKN